MTTLTCPVPQIDFDVITLSHGSGGLLTNRLLNQVIFEALRNPALEQGDDGAILTLDGQVAFTTDSFVVSPIFFPGGNIGDLAVNGTVNDIAMCGAVPKYLSLGLILEEGLTVQHLWEIITSIREAADKAGVQIVTGDTKVVDKGKGDGIYINTTGIGLMHPSASLGLDRIRPGDKVIVSGPIASHGMAIMAVRKGIEFDVPLISDTAPVAQQALALLNTFGADIRFFRDPTRGGLATVLNEVARTSRTNIRLVETSLPILEEVSDLCDILGIDPLGVANEGIFISIVAPEVAGAAVDLLHREGAASACIIGEVTEDNKGIVVISGGIGGIRVVPMPIGEQLPRIC